MHIYSKSMKNATSPLSIQKSQQICTWGGDVYYASRNLLSTCYLFSKVYLFIHWFTCILNWFCFSLIIFVFIFILREWWKPRWSDLLSCFFCLIGCTKLTYHRSLKIDPASNLNVSGCKLFCNSAICVVRVANEIKGNNLNLPLCLFHLQFIGSAWRTHC